MTVPLPPVDRERPGLLVEERWQAVFDNPHIGVAITGPDGRFRETNERFQSLVGYSGEELRRLTVLEITHPDDLATHRRAADAIRSGNSRSAHLEKRYLRKGGGVVWVRVTALMVPEREGVSGNAIALVEDVTERRAVLERLEKQDRLFRDAQRIAQFGSWEWDPIADVGVWSDELCRIVGVDAGFRPTLENSLDHVAPEARESVRRAIESAIAERKNIEYDTEIVRPDGSRRILRVSGAVVFDENGAVARMVGVTQDITERRQAEDRLRESETRYRLLFEINPSPMWVYDVETFAFLAVNEAAVRHYGYSRNEFLSMKVTEIRPAEDIPQWLEHFQSRPNPYTGGVWRHRKKDGTEVFVESMARSVDFAGRPARLVLVRDVTDRRRAEERLARSAREMRALSARLQSIREEEDARVAREVHDGIGQALTALGLDVAWLARNLNRKEGRARFAEKLRSMSALIETTTGTVERIASDLRPGILDELGLEAAAEWAVREFGERSGMACRFESQLQGNPTNLDRGTAIFRILQEALTNVARHARARRVDVRLWDDAAGLHLEVRDDGAGIDTGRIADSRSFGLLGMRERSRAFDGNCVITPHPDGGTLVSATLPEGAVRDGSDHRNGGKSDAPHSRRR
jgi:PAS domain S-box-containing protein